MKIEISSLSLIAVTAYQDLRRLLVDETVSSIAGRPVCRKLHGRHYWYDQYRIGNAVKERYIGEDSPELRARLDAHRNLAADRNSRRETRMRLVRLLRAEGAMSVDRRTGALLRAFELAGVFRLGGVLVGTQAFRLYEGELGVRIGTESAAVTQDFDIAAFERLSLSIGDSVETAPGDILRQLDFQEVPELNRNSIWRWKQAGSDTLVEFLTPSFEEDEGIRALPALKVNARALHHLNYLIADPIHAVGLYRDGVLVRIPRPERYAIHKLIVADRRQAGPDALKSRKDRAQAAFLIQILAEDRPYEMKEAYDVALDAGPRWRARLDASLKRLPETAAILTGL